MWGSQTAIQVTGGRKKVGGSPAAWAGTKVFAVFELKLSPVSQGWACLFSLVSQSTQALVGSLRDA